MKKTVFLQLAVILSIISSNAQIQITVNPSREIGEISPYIYGKNNSLSDKPSEPTSSSNWQLYKDAGLKFLRESGGNNSTKYNWRKKLTSHPDWYNNVYAHDWDYAARSLQTNMPDAKGMWAFQLLGYVAKTGAYNFNDWGYNGSQWWEGVNNNWCGGGDPNLYLEPWSADSTAAILTHWFDNLGLNKEQFQYWNMDNEPEVWFGTHDDIMPQSKRISAEEYIQRYVAVATKVRTLFPEIKIVGPVFTNEWQWYNWNDDAVPDLQNPSKRYSWVEYFIKRIAEEQQRTGMRLLDVLDFHFYPGSDRNVTLQIHRVFYDTTYDYPGANGCKRINGGWDNNITKEYIFKRSTDWLNQYMGVNHGVTMGMTEFGALYSQDPNVTAVYYASLLGTFAENNVEVFAPWDWYVGQWEVMHLFTRFAGSVAVQSSSSLINTVSAYSSINAAKDTLTVILVNRDVNNELPVNVSLQNAVSTMRSVDYYRLSNLPAGETFVSGENNALQKGQTDVGKDNFSMTLPKLSVTAVQIPLETETGNPSISRDNFTFSLFPNPAAHQTKLIFEGLSGDATITVADLSGRIRQTVPVKANGNKTETTIDISALEKGVYIIQLSMNNINYSRKLMVQ
ncbi:MAG: T9SS type A sorting domain-containing protein [Tannerella sp.]|jgi:hypothetical protein|nr:T9SS type A sorting domain-containing protein [Tannerella sp.]